ncbi:hypothetical protein ABGB14_05275 [Nonomuraea sp. B10E15]|uniref:hypothetical protein n=1 Tax=Nonomuraea sp. B10E15 TaxID=3153560 RepID=UPI00325D5536
MLGTEGRIEIDSVWYFPAVVTVKNVTGQELERFDQPVSGRGMQYQAAEAERLIAEGEVESPLMTHEQSVAVVATINAVREEIGVRCPGGQRRQKPAGWPGRRERRPGRCWAGVSDVAATGVGRSPPAR